LACSDADGWEALGLFAEHRSSFFKTLLAMPKGHPSADTFRRVFQALEPRAFQAAFRRWLKPSIFGDLDALAVLGLGSDSKRTRKTVRLPTPS
jgi:hypothetical protein